MKTSQIHTPKEMEEEQPFISTADVTAILETWQAFTHEDSPTSIKNLDKVLGEIKELKSSAVARRKNLNETTKAFRLKSKEEQVLMLTEILKPYQDEIDQLSKRAKYSEGAFTALVKSLNDTPDPCLAIESLLNTVNTGSVHTIEIERLRAELRQYDEEFQQLKNQDIKIRRLEDQLQEFKDQNEMKVAEEVSVRVAEVQLVADNKVNEIKEEQRTLERRLAAAIDSMKQAQQSADHAQSQLFEMSSVVERRVSSLQSENSILAEGTHRLTLRIAETEAENASLKKTINNLSAPPNTLVKSGADGEKEQNALTLQLMVTELREELGNQEERFRNERQRLESAARDLTQQLQKAKEDVAKTHSELAERPSREEYVSVRRQLRSLQKIAFNVQDDEEDALSSSDPENTPLGEKHQLEALLTSRMKSLETELTETRRDLTESKQREASAKETIMSLRKSLDNSANLIARLERDVEGKISAYEDKQNRQNKASGNGGSMELAELLGVSDTVSEHSNEHQSAYHSANVGGNDVNRLNASSASGSSGIGGSGGGGSEGSSSQMVSILQTQRDRYKDKLTQAESNLLKLQQKIDSAEASKTALEADNLALYGKIRFLQSVGSNSSKNYFSPKPMRIANNKNRPSQSSLASVSMNMGRRLAAGYGGYSGSEEGRMEDDEEWAQEEDVEGKYHMLYEQRMNPFAEFSQHEKQRKLQELSVADRIVLNTTMAIVSNHTGRTFMLVYLGLMHLLVFATIYYSAHRVQHGCDPGLDHHNTPPS